MRALGLMSGTSLDGIDLAVLDTDGEADVRIGPTRFMPYSDEERSLLRAALDDAAALDDRENRPGHLAAAEALVTRRHIEAVRDFLAADAAAGSIDIIGFHGQTVLHRPERRLTVQIGDAGALAKACGVDVVGELRVADVAAGGQGAPIVPVYHRALAAASGLRGSVVLVNIGGVANITVLPADGADPVACDTGPGNALLDDLMKARTGVAMDRDGAAAARGRVDERALAALLDHPYFSAPPPKSLDRNAWTSAPVAELSTEDAAATLTEFTAASIAGAIAAIVGTPAVAVVCGGGGFNPTLMGALAARLSCPVRTAADLGWAGDAIEAQAFAYLAVRSRRGLPLTFPTTTGVPRALTGGVLHVA